MLHVCNVYLTKMESDLFLQSSFCLRSEDVRIQVRDLTLQGPWWLWHSGEQGILSTRAIGRWGGRQGRISRDSTWKNTKFEVINTEIFELEGGNWTQVWVLEILRQPIESNWRSYFFCAVKHRSFQEVVPSADFDLILNQWYFWIWRRGEQRINTQLNRLTVFGVTEKNPSFRVWEMPSSSTKIINISRTRKLQHLPAAVPSLRFVDCQVNEALMDVNIPSLCSRHQVSQRKKVYRFLAANKNHLLWWWRGAENR